MLPEIERSVIDSCCCTRADTAPPGDHSPPRMLNEEEWVEFAALFAPSIDSDPVRIQKETISRNSADFFQGSSVAEQAGKQRLRVVRPQPYDDWLRSCIDDGAANELSRPWRQPKGLCGRSQTATAPPILGKLGKLVLPPVSTETAVTVTPAVAIGSATKQAGSWNFKSGARPAAVSHFLWTLHQLRLNSTVSILIRGGLCSLDYVFRF